MTQNRQIKRGTAKVRHGAISYNLRATQGPLILCIHGIGSSGLIFDPIFEQELLSQFTILTFDMLGHGSSSSSEVDDYTVESHAGSSSELLEVLELTHLPVTLICHSAGGAVGLALAKLLLNRLTGFINLEGNLIGEDCGLATRWTSAMSFTDFLERGKNTLAEKIASQGEDTSYFMATDPKAFYKMAHSVVSWSDSGHLLSTFLFELSCPRLYVYGEKNWDMPILSRLAPVPAVAIPCSGHVMMVDNPTFFYQTIGQFIRENPAIHS